MKRFLSTLLISAAVAMGGPPRSKHRRTSTTRTDPKVDRERIAQAEAKRARRAEKRLQQAQR